jgi:hypothetical protein
MVIDFDSVAASSVSPDRAKQWDFGMRQFPVTSIVGVEVLPGRAGRLARSCGVPHYEICPMLGAPGLARVQ